jgi:cytochrome c oxidase cbb3-type subunit 2
MLRGNRIFAGWQGASLVTITYVYFLIFAQFAFIKRRSSLGITDSHLTVVMAAMAIGGILISLLAPRLKLWPSLNLRLRVGLFASGSAAFLSLSHLNLASSILVSFMIGAGLGLLTVTLVTHLRHWAGNGNPLLLVGLGTGAGYFICNLPCLFAASTEVQCATSAVLCFTGIGITFLPISTNFEEIENLTLSTVPFVCVLACFTALVWLDSAAFFIIQKTPALMAGTWEGSAHLWANGTLHLLGALASVWLLRRRGLLIVLSASFLALAIACLLLLDPHRIALASIFYPIGVSLYSVALVAYPALLASASSIAERGRMAGWLYAVAGWIGSTAGIGMGQNLGHIPLFFMLVVGCVILFAWPWRIIAQRRRELTLTLGLLLAAFVLFNILKAGSASSPLTYVERGRQVYISEGCINCHTQYVRPNSLDVLIWGPVESLQELRHEHPPLIGNRRQGPDLSQVGGRRSALWLKLHFIDPPEVSGASIMPSYSMLFRDHRGDDLVSYLVSMKGSGMLQHRVEEENWHPSFSAVAMANASDGQRLFHRFCSTCHDAGGQTRWADGFKRRPPDLTVGPYLHLSFSGDIAEQQNRLAHIVKFGIQGTDMPGHEYLPDNEIASISLWLSQQIRQPNPNQ